ncbi:MAG TPA: response regulator transcription factor [Candidatus Sulfotelmatobacter sp.]|nr:response regulator transcription factor [Candidatus Sulfotelmatobacter sp.]
MNKNILLVEDEPGLRSALSLRLSSAGYSVDTAQDGVEAFEKATSQPFDLIILDLMLPARSGLDVCRDIRQAGLATPILMLTALHQTTDKVVGLKIGADDYVTKPFKAAELMARVEVLLRHVSVHTGCGVFQFGPIRVDFQRREVTRDQKPVTLAAREFQLLQYLIEQTGRTVPRAELLRSVWGFEGDSMTRTVDAHIAALRHKLEVNPRQPELILTVAGVGYKFVGSRAI